MGTFPEEWLCLDVSVAMKSLIIFLPDICSDMRPRHAALINLSARVGGARGEFLHWFSGFRICSLFNTAASVQRLISPATGTMCFRDPRASCVRGSPRCSRPGVTIDPSVKVRLLPSINPALSRIRPDIWSTDVSESHNPIPLILGTDYIWVLKEYFTQIWKLASCHSKTVLFPPTHFSYNKSG